MGSPLGHVGLRHAVPSPGITLSVHTDTVPGYLGNGETAGPAAASFLRVSLGLIPPQADTPAQSSRPAA